MLKQRRFSIKLLATALSFSFFTTNCLLAGAQESRFYDLNRRRTDSMISTNASTYRHYLKFNGAVRDCSVTRSNFWSERRKSQTTLLALAPLPAIDGKSTPLNFPTTYHSASFQQKISTLPPSFAPLIGKPPSAYGNIQKISTAGAQNSLGQTVILIQDVHRNPEAQKNIRETVRSLVGQKGIGLVALEGAFPSDSFNLPAIRRSPYQNNIRKSADYLLKTNKISGPIHAALTTPESDTPFIGIDDDQHYRKNVEAVRASFDKRPAVKAELGRQIKTVEEEKNKFFNWPLLAFDRQAQVYHDGQLPIGAYAKLLLTKANPKTNEFPNISAFLKVLALEENLNVQGVETERTRLVEKLTRKLTTKKSEEFLQMTVAFRLGQLQQADFYSYLEELCRGGGLTLTQYPAMKAYVSYVLATKNLAPEAILHEVSQIEERVYGSLITTPKEKELLEVSKRLALTWKLVDFELSAEEWKEYKTSHAHANSACESFEQFYEEADARSQLIVNNLLLAMKAYKTNTAVLIAGGFHSEKISNELNQKGIAVITFSPKITHLRTTNNVGSGGQAQDDYLSVFTQEKTPLEKLFEGEKLFLSPHPEPLAVRDGSFPAQVVASENLAKPGSIDANRVFHDLAPTSPVNDAAVHNATLTEARVEMHTEKGTVTEIIDEDPNGDITQTIDKEETPSLLAKFWDSPMIFGEKLRWMNHVTRSAFSPAIFPHELFHWLEGKWNGRTPTERLRSWHFFQAMPWVTPAYWSLVGFVGNGLMFFLGWWIGGWTGHYIQWSNVIFIISEIVLTPLARPLGISNYPDLGRKYKEKLRLYDDVFNRAKGVKLVVVDDVASAGERWAVAILRAWQDLMFTTDGTPTKGAVLTNFCTGDTPWMGYGVLIHWIKNWTDHDVQEKLEIYKIKTERKFKPDMARVLARPLDSLFPQKRDAYYSFVFQLEKLFDKLGIPQSNRKYFYGDLLMDSNDRLHRMTESEFNALEKDVKQHGLLIEDYLGCKGNDEQMFQFARKHPLQFQHLRAMEEQSVRMSKEMEQLGGAQLTLLDVGPSYDGYGHIAFLEQVEPGQLLHKKAFIGKAVHHVTAGQAKENGGLANLIGVSGKPTIGVTRYGYDDLFFRHRRGDKQYVVALATNNKAKSIQRAIEEPEDPSRAPLSVLQELKSDGAKRLGTLIIDRSSADKLRLRSYPWEFSRIHWTPELIKQFFVRLSLDTGIEISKLKPTDFLNLPVPDAGSGSMVIRQIREWNLQSLIKNRTWGERRKKVVQDLLKQLMRPADVIDLLGLQAGDTVLLINPHLDDEYLAMPNLIRAMSARGVNMRAAYLAGGYTAVHDDYVFSLLEKIQTFDDSVLFNKEDLKSVTTDLANFPQKRVHYEPNSYRYENLHPWSQMLPEEQDLRAKALLCQLQTWMEGQHIPVDPHNIRVLLQNVIEITKGKPAWGSEDLDIVKQIKTWIRITSNASAMISLGLKFENISPPMDMTWYGTQVRGLAVTPGDIEKVKGAIKGENGDKKLKLVISNREKFSDRGAHATTEVSTLLALVSLVREGAIDPETIKLFGYAGVWYRKDVAQTDISVLLTAAETKRNRDEFPKFYPDQVIAPVADPATTDLNIFSDQVFYNGRVGVNEVRTVLGSRLPQEQDALLREDESNVLNYDLVHLADPRLSRYADAMKTELEKVAEAKARASNKAIQGPLPKPQMHQEQMEALMGADKKMAFVIKSMVDVHPALSPPQSQQASVATPPVPLDNPHARSIIKVQDFISEFRPLTTRLQITSKLSQEEKKVATIKINPFVTVDLEKGLTYVEENFLNMAALGALPMSVPEEGEDPVERALTIIALQAGCMQHRWNAQNAKVTSDQVLEWRREAGNRFPLSSHDSIEGEGGLADQYRGMFGPNLKKILGKDDRDKEKEADETTTAIRAAAQAADELQATPEEITRLIEPDWVYRFELNDVELALGQKTDAVGWRVHHGNLLGPYKGGLRYYFIPDKESVLKATKEVVENLGLGLDPDTTNALVTEITNHIFTGLRSGLDEKVILDMSRDIASQMQDHLGPDRLQSINVIRKNLPPELNEAMVRDLALEMAIKCALKRLTDEELLPYGGAKGGLRIDFSKLSSDPHDPERDKELKRRDLQRITRALARKLTVLNAVGPDLDIPAPDIATTNEMMAWFADEYIRELTRTGKLNNYKELVDLLSSNPEEDTPFIRTYRKLLAEGKLKKEDQDALAVITGKPIAQGGLPGRTEATGRGVVLTIDQILAHLGLGDLEGKKVAIQALGNVGYYTALFLHRLGAIIVSVGEMGGVVINENGIDIEALHNHLEKTRKETGRATVVGFSAGEGGVVKEGLPGVDALFVKGAHILIPAAGPNQITRENVERINADTVHDPDFIVGEDKAIILAEAANGPTTPEAVQWILQNLKNFHLLVDIFVNSDGVAVSYLEWLYDLERLFEEKIKGNPLHRNKQEIRKAMDVLRERDEKEIQNAIEARERKERPPVGQQEILNAIDTLRTAVEKIQDEMNYITNYEVLVELQEHHQKHPDAPLDYRKAAYRLSMKRRLEALRKRRETQQEKSTAAPTTLAKPPPAESSSEEVTAQKRAELFKNQMSPLAQEFRYRYLPYVTATAVSFLIATGIAAFPLRNAEHLAYAIGVVIFIALYLYARKIALKQFLSRHKINPLTGVPYTAAERSKLTFAAELFGVIFKLWLYMGIAVTIILVWSFFPEGAVWLRLLMAAGATPLLGLWSLSRSTRRHVSHNDESDAPASLPKRKLEGEISHWKFIARDETNEKGQIVPFVAALIETTAIQFVYSLLDPSLPTWKVAVFTVGLAHVFREMHRFVYDGLNREPRPAEKPDRRLLFWLGITFAVPFAAPFFGITLSSDEQFWISAGLHLARALYAVAYNKAQAITGGRTAKETIDENTWAETVVNQLAATRQLAIDSNPKQIATAIDSTLKSVTGRNDLHSLNNRLLLLEGKGFGPKWAPEKFEKALEREALKRLPNLKLDEASYLVHTLATLGVETQPMETFLESYAVKGNAASVLIMNPALSEDNIDKFVGGVVRRHTNRDNEIIGEIVFVAPQKGIAAHIKSLLNQLKTEEGLKIQNAKIVVHPAAPMLDLNEINESISKQGVHLYEFSDVRLFAPKDLPFRCETKNQELRWLRNATIFLVDESLGVTETDMRLINTVGKLARIISKQA